MSENSTEKMSRRDFLGKSLKGVAGAFLATKIPEVSSKESFNIVTLDEIKDQSMIEFQIHNEPGIKNIFFTYFSADEHIGIRNENGQQKCISFEDGQEIKRRYGEITNPTLFKVKRTHEGRVGVYPKLDGYLDTMEGRKELPEGDIYAIPVIVGPCNYFPDQGRLPLENNPISNEEYGSGYIVGYLEPKEGGYHFDALGYVCDARALTVIN